MYRSEGAVKNRLGFALVGCGRIAQRHADVLANERVPGGHLAAVCDVVPERAEAMGRRYGVPHFRDMHEMMSKLGSEIDVLNVLTESGSHARNCVELAKYQRHIVVEKPMALTLADADDMIRVCDDAGIKLFVVKQNRYNLPVRKLRQAIETGRFGKLVMGTVRVRWMRDQSYYDQAAWRGTWAEDGGVFANQASHHIDLLEWMLGEPESVFAYARTALVKIETEDTGVAVIRFRNGALGVIEATTATRPKDLEGAISILGERGTVEIGGFAVNEMKVWSFVDPTPEDAEIPAHYRENPPNVYGFGHAAYLEHVVDSVLNGSPSLVDGLEGRKSLELITALYESIETGREVPLRFRPTKCRLGFPKG
jgi:UDP-N-acetyl-2-amino-2-deoxyglucuronate dehydrogenase